MLVIFRGQIAKLVKQKIFINFQIETSIGFRIVVCNDEKLSVI